MTPIKTDAYQAGHFLLIPPGMEDFQCSQNTFRKPLLDSDYRVISAGLRLFVEDQLRLPITMDDVEEADWFYNDFHADVRPPFSRPYPYPKELFTSVVKDYDGIMPIVVTGLKDGQAHYVGEPNVQVWTDVPGMGELVGWVESNMLPYLWSMSTVATRGRIRKDKFIAVYKKCYPSLTDAELHQMIAYKFHDFGRRGAVDAVKTGIAHLYNWLGTDTVDAAHLATVLLNGRQKFGACSIMAAAHRTITPWETEDAAYAHQIPQFADTLQSVVADSYDYFNGVTKLSGYAELVKEKGGVLVARPDSSDPVECVVKGLEILDKTFGHTLQETGLKVLCNTAIIQGDGVNDTDIFDRIIPAVIEAGYCPSNVAFGMGENNHKCVRSELEAGYKTCLAGERPVMKGSNSKFKTSFPCAIRVDCNEGEKYVGCRVKNITVEDLKRGLTGDLVVHFDGRPNGLEEHYYDFNETRELAYNSWNALPAVPAADTISAEIRALQREYLASH
jgi:nicotinic acid phosphoribosyltransferase